MIFIGLKNLIFDFYRMLEFNFVTIYLSESLSSADLTSGQQEKQLQTPTMVRENLKEVIRVHKPSTHHCSYIYSQKVKKFIRESYDSMIKPPRMNYFWVKYYH
jgi:hypothetical protein